MALEITDSNYEELVMQSTQPVVVDFWAEWCGPCKMIGPVIDEMATEYEGRALVGKVNVDNNSEFSAKYGVRSIPTVLFFQNGVVVDRSVGAVPKSGTLEIVPQFESCDFPKSDIFPVVASAYVLLSCSSTMLETSSFIASSFALTLASSLDIGVNFSSEQLMIVNPINKIVISFIVFIIIYFKV